MQAGQSGEGVWECVVMGMHEAGCHLTVGDSCLQSAAAPWEFKMLQQLAAAAAFMPRLCSCLFLCFRDKGRAFANQFACRTGGRKRGFFLPWVKVLLNVCLVFFPPPNLSMSKGISGVFD